MLRAVRLAAVLAALVALSGPALAADKPAATKSFADAVQGLARQDGLLPVYVDKAKGRILLQLPPPGPDGVSGRFLYLTALRTGLGSAQAELDRSKAGPTQILAFRRIGAKVVAEYENPRFRAAGAPEAEAAAARDSFAVSTAWVHDLEAETPDGGVLVDVSSFLTRDVMGAADLLNDAGGKDFKLSADLSVAEVGAVKVFPENIELEARETFVSDKPGDEVSSIAPDAKSVTLIVRHSLVKLPGPGFEPRRFDPRVGGFTTLVNDYAAPLGQEIVYRLAKRFRLEKTDPAAARSTVKTPIVFYVDRAAPEPIRAALVEGGNWWAKAFDQAGYIDAFRVEVMPEGMDPLDVRYNVVNWDDRMSRGWSYGQEVVDPRTGEIVKGAVLLGALRVRQDMLIFEGMVGADRTGKGGPDDPVTAALARIRQLGAHEIGHALGFTHNFAGSTQDRSSVMDYPPPRLKLADGRIDLSDAYAVGVGAWDRFTVDWLYGDVPPGEAGAAALDAKARAAVASGLRFVTDADARPLGAAQPWGSLWDDGPDPAAELTRMLQVRRVALQGFGLAALHPGEAAANLRRRYVPIFLLHRYQVDAAAKLVAGVDYPYAVKGDARPEARPVAADRQRAALSALLVALAPAELDTPEALIPLLSSAQSGDPDRAFDIEVIGDPSKPVFDPLLAAEIAAGLPIDALIAPDRLNRLVDQHRRDAAMPGVEEVTSALIATAFRPAPGRLAEVARRVQMRLVLDLSAADRDPQTSPAAAAGIEAGLTRLAAQLKAAPGTDPAEQAHRARLARLLADRKAMDKLLERKDLRPPVPPGMPIGDDGEE